MLDSTEGACPQGLGYFVFGYVVWVTVLGNCAFAFGVSAFRLQLERWANLFTLTLLLQLFEFVEEEVELLGIHQFKSYISLFDK